MGATWLAQPGHLVPQQVTTKAISSVSNPGPYQAPDARGSLPPQSKYSQSPARLSFPSSHRSRSIEQASIVPPARESSSIQANRQLRQPAKSKKQRRVAAKRLRKLAALHPEGLAPKIPLEQQSIDLPRNEEGTVEGALAAGEARDEITRRLRMKRRGEIKTSNYLKGMR